MRRVGDNPPHRTTRPTYCISKLALAEKMALTMA